MSDIYKSATVADVGQPKSFVSATGRGDCDCLGNGIDTFQGPEYA